VKREHCFASATHDFVIALHDRSRGRHSNFGKGPREHLRVGSETDKVAMTPAQRAEAVVRVVFGDSLAHESHLRTSVGEAISTAIAEERRNCARLLDGINDEFVDWCAINGISSVEQVQIANMLSKAAAMIRGGISSALNPGGRETIS
jgi:hypothetical protein